MTCQPPRRLICFIYFLSLIPSDFSVAVLSILIFMNLLKNLLTSSRLVLRSRFWVQVLNIILEDVQVRRVKLELTDVHKLDLLSQLLLRFNF